MAISGNCTCLKVTIAITIALLCFRGTSTLAFYVGGIRDVPNFQHSPLINRLAGFALNEFNKQQGAQNAHLSLSKVVRAREQMVSGMVYYLTMEALDSHRTTGSYLAQVWVVPWRNFTQLEEFKQLDADKCVALTATHSLHGLTTRKLDGAQAPLGDAVGAQDPIVKEAAENAVKIIQQRSNSLMPYKLQEIVSAKEKVVNALKIFNLLLKIKWENKVKNYKVEMERTLEGKWTMKHMQR